MPPRRPRVSEPGGFVGGRSPVPGQREVYCVAPDCDQESNALAPVPLCPEHLRKVAAFTAELVEARLLEMQAKAEADLPAPILTPDRGDAPGWVYLVRFGDRVKIGYSTQPEQRLRQLPHESVLAVIPGSPAVERELLGRFSHLRCVGEWHFAGLDLLEYAHDLNRRAV